MNHSKLIFCSISSIAEQLIIAKNSIKGEYNCSQFYACHDEKVGECAWVFQSQLREVVTRNNLHHKYLRKCPRAGFDLCPTTHIKHNHQTEFTGYFNYGWEGRVQYTKIFWAITKAGMDVWTITCSLVLSVDNAVYTGGSIEQVFKAWKTLFGQLLYGVAAWNVIWDKDTWHFLRQDRDWSLEVSERIMSLWGPM